MATSHYSAFGDKIDGVSGRCRVFFDLFEINRSNPYHMRSAWSSYQESSTAAPNPLESTFELRGRIILFDGEYRDQSIDVMFAVRQDDPQEFSLLDKDGEETDDSKNATSLRIKNVWMKILKKHNIRTSHDIR